MVQSRNLASGAGEKLRREHVPVAAGARSGEGQPSGTQGYDDLARLAVVHVTATSSAVTRRLVSFARPQSPAAPSTGRQCVAAHRYCATASLSALESASPSVFGNLRSA